MQNSGLLLGPTVLPQDPTALRQDFQSDLQQAMNTATVDVVMNDEQKDDKMEGDIAMDDGIVVINGNDAVIAEDSFNNEDVGLDVDGEYRSGD